MFANPNSLYLSLTYKECQHFSRVYASSIKNAAFFLHSSDEYHHLLRLADIFAVFLNFFNSSTNSFHSVFFVMFFYMQQTFYPSVIVTFVTRRRFKAHVHYPSCPAKIATTPEAHVTSVTPRATRQGHARYVS